MPDITTTFDYASLAADARLMVQSRTTEIRDRMGRAAQNVVEIGLRLIDVKDCLPHGKFGDWLDAEFGWSERAAQRMMQVGRQFKTANLSEMKAAPSALYLLASPSMPEEVKEQFTARVTAGEPVTHAEIKEAVALKVCGECGQKWMAHLGCCPYCEKSAEQRIDELQESKRKFIDEAPLRAMEACDAIDAAKAAAEPADDHDLTAPDFTLESLVAAGKKFGTLYIDPPWQYGNQATRAATDNHYPTMNIDELAALPVGELAAERSHLWLWTTNGFLFECPRLFGAWGFAFKSSYVWVKPQIGIGNYLRNSHEFLLLAVRGGLTAAARDVKSWGEFPRAGHSAKPEAIRRDVVERISPGPRLELFGRRRSDGWMTWGNQVETDLYASGV